MEGFNSLLHQLEPRTFVFNLTSPTGTVSSAYATVIVLAISFAIAAIGGLLYYGLQNMSSARYGYAADSYDYQRFEQDYHSRRSEDYLDQTSTLAQMARADEKYNEQSK